jgi:hypothetical protein
MLLRQNQGNRRAAFDNRPVCCGATAHDAIAGAFGVLPGLLNSLATGPLICEAQGHLAQFVLQPIAEITAQEASDKLEPIVSIDLITLLQAYDEGGRARAFATMIEGLANAKAAGLSPETVKASLAFIDERGRSQR